LFTEKQLHDRHTFNVIRPIATLVLFATSLSSCSTFLSLISSPPVMMLDQAASSMLGLLSENELPPGGRPQSIQNPARQQGSRALKFDLIGDRQKAVLDSGAIFAEMQPYCIPTPWTGTASALIFPSSPSR
jgi:hypothetical protein